MKIDIDAFYSRIEIDYRKSIWYKWFSSKMKFFIFKKSEYHLILYFYALCRKLRWV